MNAQVQEEPGQIQLFERLQQGGISIAALSRETGVPRPTIYYWTTRLPPEPVRKLVTRLLNRHGVDPIGIWSREKVHMGSVIRLVPSPKTTRKTKKMDVTAAESLTDADLAHFGLAQDPFEYIANPEDTWFPDALQRMQEKILRSLKSKGIVVVAGDPGGGKTTLLRKMYASLLQNRRVKLISPASLDRSKITSAALSVAIIRDLVGTDTSGWAAEARSELLRRTLEEQNNAGISPVLTLDEAHKLTDNALVAIKQVWDSHVLLRQLSVLLI
ncbi:MAG TPA: AAA family ATPase, partial [Myxococcota bacterium]|nr:AAA family ATPase [Myxococcota bacterium]